MTRLIASLQRSGHPLASPEAQRARLASYALNFHNAVAQRGGLTRLQNVEALQINLGKRCNQTCHHCHVDAGPDRREVMTDAVLDACIAFAIDHKVQSVDLTGGAPEMHPRFRETVERLRRAGVRVVDRCNLTITQLPNYADLPEFFALHEVEVVASLPWYRASQTDAQRGDGVFEQSIAALRTLNALGYGQEGSGRILNLVTNPSGAFLPAKQEALERDWKAQLKRLHGITFNQLFTITNMPISRFLEYLDRTGQVDAYMTKLVQALNPAALAGVMCRSTLSVGWDGKLYDCDFNQMLELPLEGTIEDIATAVISGRPIRTDAHCLGCIAGAGSSCGGATTP